MNKPLLRILALTALSGGALLAQNISGNWQGSLKAGPQDLRVVLKISLDNDKLKAVFYSIDQGAMPFPVTAITKDGSTVKVTIAALNGNYEGKVSSDGNSMAGNWTQGGQPLPLNLTRATPETAWTIPEPPPPPVRMPADAKPGVEVATVKPSDPNRPGKLFTVKGQDILTINTTLSDIVTMAYDLHAKQITGAPAWFESEKYDLTVRPDVSGQPNTAQIKMILQKLVADRFELKFHREKKELAVYAITLAKAEPKFKKSESDPNGLPGLMFGGAGPGGGLNFNVRNATIAEVSSVLQGSVLDKPVVDQTGLPGKYDFTVKFTPDPTQMTGFGPRPPAADNPDAPPDIFAAFDQQLGLKLAGAKAQVDVLVIDKVEKPSAN